MSDGFVNTDYVGPICLPSVKPSPQLWCEVAGWGSRKKHGDPMSEFEDIFGDVFNVFTNPMFMRKKRSARRGKGRSGKSKIQHSRRGKNVLQTANIGIVKQEKCEKSKKKLV